MRLVRREILSCAGRPKPMSNRRRPPYFWAAAAVWCLGLLAGLFVVSEQGCKLDGLVGIVVVLVFVVLGFGVFAMGRKASKMQVQKLEFENRNNSKVHLQVEPWPMEWVIKPGQTCQLYFESFEPMPIGVWTEGDYTRIFSEGQKVRVVCDGEEVIFS